MRTQPQYYGFSDAPICSPETFATQSMASAYPSQFRGTSTSSIRQISAGQTSQLHRRRRTGFCATRCKDRHFHSSTALYWTYCPQPMEHCIVTSTGLGWAAVQSLRTHGVPPAFCGTPSALRVVQNCYLRRYCNCRSAAAQNKMTMHMRVLCSTASGAVPLLVEDRCWINFHSMEDSSQSECTVRHLGIPAKPI